MRRIEPYSMLERCIKKYNLEITPIDDNGVNYSVVYEYKDVIITESEKRYSGLEFMLTKITQKIAAKELKELDDI